MLLLVGDGASATGFWSVVRCQAHGQGVRCVPGYGCDGAPSLGQKMFGRSRRSVEVATRLGSAERTYRPDAHRNSVRDVERMSFAAGVLGRTGTITGSRHTHRSAPTVLSEGGGLRNSRVALAVDKRGMNRFTTPSHSEQFVARKSCRSALPRACSSQSAVSGLLVAWFRY
jgi:hypothetical protein